LNWHRTSRWRLKRRRVRIRRRNAEVVKMYGEGSAVAQQLTIKNNVQDLRFCKLMGSVYVFQTGELGYYE